MKRFLGFLVIGIILFSLTFVLAEDNFDESFEEHEKVFDELKEEYSDEEIMDSGLTPDSPFYFLDGIIDSREEKVAEIKAMVEEGNYEAARKAKEKYKKYAEDFVEDADPDEREETRRSATAIYNALNEIKEDISGEEQEEFVDEILEEENGILTAVEISDKIKTLCMQLARLDPMEYSRMCRADDDSPNWQKRLDKDLSEEQKKTAKEFVSIMKKCFKTSGQDCSCEEIPFYDFSIACSKAAPLATACDIGGDEIACEELENLEMPELPDWLQPIWRKLEGEMRGAQYDMHMPRECVEEGATTRKACAIVMVKTNAPIECRSALMKAAEEGEVDREVFERICDKIMMQQHAPECAKAGISDPEECKEYYIKNGFKRPEDDFGSGPRDSGFGRDCTTIEDPMERLECYDNKGNEMGDYYGPIDGEMPEGEITWQCKEHRIHWPPDCKEFMENELPKILEQSRMEAQERMAQEDDWRVKERECAASCDLENGWWDFRDENGDGTKECVCYATEKSDDYYDDSSNGDYEESECKDGCSQECGDQNTDCVDGRCVCLGGGEDEQPSQEEPSQPSEEETTPESETSSEPESVPEESAPEPEPTEESNEAPVTGEVVNRFLEYYYR